MEISRKQRVIDAVAQYTEGAITYVEFFRFCVSLLTDEDLTEHLAKGNPDKLNTLG